jgi:hypothetical protein
MLSNLGGALSGIVHGVAEGVGNVAGAVTKGVGGLGSAGVSLERLPQKTPARA